ncbi:hypothetical protein VPH35_117584 [Triticum aestivum]|uniref:Serine-threonine/tyrosine-protein kinase catalytic domain-containing protein n=2 Tax=Aegilops tauschii subsp. strangulata TaxID=200361 RepID=A0A453P999_AEGTS
MPQNIGDQTSEAQLVTRHTHWGFACSILEMFSGIQPWRAKSSDEIYQSAVVKKEKQIFPYNLHTEVENVLSGCFEYDFRDRSLMSYILQSFESAQDVDCNNTGWDSYENPRPTQPSRTNWSHFKDML